MNKIAAPSAWRNSSKRARNLSSKSPRNPVPASNAPISSDQSSRHFASCRGTRPAAMRCATASATAVLPTPGAPTKQTLFLVRRDNTRNTRATSSSRPITGSNLPASANCTKSVPHAANVGRNCTDDGAVAAADDDEAPPTVPCNEAKGGEGEAPEARRLAATPGFVRPPGAFPCFGLAAFGANASGSAAGTAGGVGRRPRSSSPWPHTGAALPCISGRAARKASNDMPCASKVSCKPKGGSNTANKRSSMAFGP
mmetsp:Transcript_89614/g.256753  ORF Transcript_89614/g.256753 Transcript_89614/m.256753 type:complete len:255 (-) Transcript_89614:404-1168(-)